ncbi:MAG: ABC transporter substrate-binding protein [Alphaproteobacteria bacterium]|nr:MAG: ABC transporter substrate-binding protein [Alphaproteobacteria bacterium]
MYRLWLAFLVIALPFTAITAAAEETPQPMHAVAMHGAPKYGPDFKHVDYVNPDAPKGGEMRLATSGTFDTLNPFVLKGVAAPGIGMTVQTLTTGTDDEAFTRYGLIAETIEMPEDRSWVAFNLRKEARFNDGTPITADDVVWTFNALMAKGHPHYRAYYANVKEAKAESPSRVKFTFNMAGNRELPLIVGEMPVLSRHYWEGKNFESTTLEAPLGSGPYRVKSIEPGRRVTYERVKDWWAENLPIMKGQNNFDAIIFDVYRDETVLLQALFSGNYDFRAENIAKSWAVEYDQKPVKEGLIKKEEIKHSLPAGMQAFAYNIRRPLFQDPKVRQALGYAFDFEWSNKQFAYGAYHRTKSYFENSELASSGMPQGRELEILEQYRGKVPDEVFTSEFRVPQTDGSGAGVRENLGKAKELLNAAGWRLGAKGLLEKDGQEFKFEILTNSENFERWINPFISNLKKLGIQANLRNVEAAQYQNRIENFDFDMTVHTFGQSLSPGNEQRDFWGSDKADVKGSRNIIGIKSPVLDDLVGRLVSAKDREALIALCHAIDRVLLWNYYVIPQFYHDKWRVAYWDKFGHPETTPKYGLGVPDTWWYDKEKADKIAEKVVPDKKK